MGEINYKRPLLTDYQSKIIDSPSRFTITEASTKSGKTASHIVWLIEQALQLNKNQVVWWVAPVFSQAKIAFRRIKNQVNNPSFFKANESELSLTLPTGAIIQFKSADNPDNLYGEDVFAFVFDEFTRAREDAWFALRSTITATNGKGKFIGNVKGKKNWGYKLGQSAKNDHRTEWEYFKITAYDAINAGILLKEEVDMARKDLPERVFNELYLAEASEEGANPFGYTHIMNRLRPLSILEPMWFGVDLAKSYDYTVIIGLDETGMISYFERFQMDWTQTRKRIIEIIGNKPAVIDSTGVGDPILEDIQKECSEVIGYKFTSESKQKLMDGLVMSIQSGTTSVLDGVHRQELESFEFHYTLRGVKYSAPDGEHDDTVCAHSLAIYCKGNVRSNELWW